jgi:transcriptional regulator GlxA family with amidase domain
LYFLPMPHTVAILAHPGFELLDVTGPVSVFTGANHLARRSGKKPFYSVEVVSPAGGLVTSDGGVALDSRALQRVAAANVDTLLIAGGHGETWLAAIGEPVGRRWIPRCAAAAARFGSICTGAFVLAALGLVNGKRVATHWMLAARLAEKHPLVKVDSDALYLVDGKVWTSAGVTAGIDMVLAMVARDVGDAAANNIAKALVLYARRPGYQSQFSPLLRLQLHADDPFSELIEWMRGNLNRPLHVPTLAARAGLSERSFHRKFVSVTGQSPARVVEALRLDEARVLLSQRLPLKVIAARVGLSPTTRFTAAFERRFGITPRLFREIHGGLVNGPKSGRDAG